MRPHLVVLITVFMALQLGRPAFTQTRGAAGQAVTPSQPSGEEAEKSYPPPFPRPNAVKLFETDRIRVWDIVWPKGQPSPMHKHPYDQVGTYYIAGGRLITQPNGEKRTGFTQVGQISTTRKGTLHIEEGTTDPPLHAVFIELKSESPSGQTIPKPTKPSPFPREGAKQVFDDERVTIWDYTWSQGTKTDQYRQNLDTLVVFLGEGRIRWTSAKNRISETAAVPGRIRYTTRGTIESEEVMAGSPRGIVFAFK